MGYGPDLVRTITPQLDRIYGSDQTCGNGKPGSRVAFAFVANLSCPDQTRRTRSGSKAMVQIRTCGNGKPGPGPLLP